MLKSMLVKNFAIIDNIQIEFDSGMSVLTGETGAGKSLIIDAIGLLFGDRASSELVRHGESKAVIEGIFTNVSEKVNDILQEEGIDEEDFLTIKREIYENGKSLCKVNGNSVSLSFLQELSSTLGNIHTQFDNTKLVNPKNYLDFIDDENIKELLVVYQNNLKKYNKIKKEYDTLLKNEEENNQKLDFYRYQYSDLTKAGLNVSEEEELKSRLSVLNNMEKITSNINDFISAYDEYDVLDKIYESIQSLEKIEKYDSKFTEYKKQVEENYYAIEEILNQVKINFSKQDLDIDELNNINDRLGVYSDYKRKYKMTTEEIVLYLDKIKSEIEKIENFDELSKDLKKDLDNAHKELLEIALTISNNRKELAKELSISISKNLKDLQLDNTVLEILVNSNPDSFKKNGIDEIEMMITFNKGEPLKPLSKVASGGELSRFMLAFKAITAKNFTNQTLIFDEIDSGVSGAIAYSIANKIKEISLNSQVLCVTHLVQVAAKSDHQLFLSKEIDSSNRTVTKIKELTDEERIEEISKMASFGNVSEASRNFAKELLNK